MFSEDPSAPLGLPSSKPATTLSPGCHSWLSTLSHDLEVGHLKGICCRETTWKKMENYRLAVCQNLVPLVNIKIAGKWMFIPLKMVLIGIDPYPFRNIITWAFLWNLILHSLHSSKNKTWGQSKSTTDFVMPCAGSDIIMPDLCSAVRH